MTRISLLLVEDDPDIRDVIELALKLDDRIEVQSYESAEAALESIRVDERDFDIALLDFHLPHMNGIDLHRHLREFEALPHLVTVLITAGMSKADIEASQAADIAGLIAKPFDALTLAREVRVLAQSARRSGSGITWLGRTLR